MFKCTWEHLLALDLRPLSKFLSFSVKGRPHYYSSRREEYAHIRFDLDAGESCFPEVNMRLLINKPLDFSSLFNWNTKQLFVYITATWPSSSSSPSIPPSQAVIWDTIINSESQSHPFTPFDLFNSLKASSGSVKKPGKSPSPKSGNGVKPGIIHLKNSKPKYQITDIGGKLSSRENVTLEVSWNIQPWVGALTWTLGEGKSWGRWSGIRGGKTQAFDLPALKGKSVSQESVVGSQQKPKAAEASAVE